VENLGEQGAGLVAQRNEVDIPIGDQAVRKFCRTHKAPEYGGLKQYVQEQHSCFVAVPGLGMVNLLHFGRAEEEAFAGVPLDKFMMYCQDFHRRIVKQSGRLRALVMMTPKGCVAVPGACCLRKITELSEAELSALEIATDHQLSHAFFRLTGYKRHIKAPEPNVKPTRRERIITTFVPPDQPMRLNFELARMV
jgi:hypothetical protein